MEKNISCILVVTLIILGFGFLFQSANSMGIISIHHPEAPIGVAGYLYTADGEPLPDGIKVMVYNSGNKVYSNETSQNGAYASGIAGRGGDVIYVYIGGENDYGCNKVTVDTDKVTQWCNVTIGQHLCEVADTSIDWMPLLYFLSASGCFTFAGVVSYEENLLDGGKK